MTWLPLDGLQEQIQLILQHGGIRIKVPWALPPLVDQAEALHQAGRPQFCIGSRQFVQERGQRRGGQPQGLPQIRRRASRLTKPVLHKSPELLPVGIVQESCGRTPGNLR